MVPYKIFLKDFLEFHIEQVIVVADTNDVYCDRQPCFILVFFTINIV